MKKSLIPLLIAIAALFCLPLFVHNPYYIHLVETILIYTILLYGLDIVVGYVGQVSLGHAALFGIGSYTAGVLYFHFGWTIWGTLPASIIVTSIFGGILALPALKVIGPYLAMVTLAFGTIAQILINEMTWLTEGPLGIKIPKPDLMGVPMTKAEYFWMVGIS
jgi:ABC-type branched-subunit amino acid transport system permease subunit